MASLLPVFDEFILDFDAEEQSQLQAQALGFARLATYQAGLDAGPLRRPPNPAANEWGRTSVQQSSGGPGLGHVGQTFNAAATVPADSVNVLSELDALRREIARLEQQQQQQQRQGSVKVGGGQATARTAPRGALVRRPLTESGGSVSAAAATSAGSARAGAKAASSRPDTSVALGRGGKRVRIPPQAPGSTEAAVRKVTADPPAEAAPALRPANAQTGPARPDQLSAAAPLVECEPSVVAGEGRASQLAGSKRVVGDSAHGNIQTQLRTQATRNQQPRQVQAGKRKRALRVVDSTSPGLNKAILTLPPAPQQQQQQQPSQLGALNGNAQALATKRRQSSEQQTSPTAPVQPRAKRTTHAVAPGLADTALDVGEATRRTNEAGEAGTTVIRQSCVAGGPSTGDSSRHNPAGTAGGFTAGITSPGLHTQQGTAPGDEPEPGDEPASVLLRKLKRTRITATPPERAAAYGGQEHALRSGDVVLPSAPDAGAAEALMPSELEVIAEEDLGHTQAQERHGQYTAHIEQQQRAQTPSDVPMTEREGSAHSRGLNTVRYPAVPLPGVPSGIPGSFVETPFDPISAEAERAANAFLMSFMTQIADAPEIGPLPPGPQRLATEQHPGGIEHVTRGLPSTDFGDLAARQAAEQQGPSNCLHGARRQAQGPGQHDLRTGAAALDRDPSTRFTPEQLHTAGGSVELAPSDDLLRAEASPRSASCAGNAARRAAAERTIAAVQRLRRKSTGIGTLEAAPSTCQGSHVGTHGVPGPTGATPLGLAPPSRGPTGGATSTLHHDEGPGAGDDTPALLRIDEPVTDIAEALLAPLPSPPTSSHVSMQEGMPTATAADPRESSIALRHSEQGLQDSLGAMGSLSPPPACSPDPGPETALPEPDPQQGLPASGRSPMSTTNGSQPVSSRGPPWVQIQAGDLAVAVGRQPPCRPPAETLQETFPQQSGCAGDPQHPQADYSAGAVPVPACGRTSSGAGDGFAPDAAGASFAGVHLATASESLPHLLPFWPAAVAHPGVSPPIGVSVGIPPPPLSAGLPPMYPPGVRPHPYPPGPSRFTAAAAFGHAAMAPGWVAGPPRGVPLPGGQVVSFAEVDLLARKELLLLKWHMLQELAADVEAEWREVCLAHNRLRVISMQQPLVRATAQDIATQGEGGPSHHQAVPGASVGAGPSLLRQQQISPPAGRLHRQRQCGNPPGEAPSLQQHASIQAEVRPSPQRLPTTIADPPSWPQREISVRQPDHQSLQAQQQQPSHRQGPEAPQPHRQQGPVVEQLACGLSNALGTAGPSAVAVPDASVHGAQDATLTACTSQNPLGSSIQPPDMPSQPAQRVQQQQQHGTPGQATTAPAASAPVHQHLTGASGSVLTADTGSVPHHAELSQHGALHGEGRRPAEPQALAFVPASSTGGVGLAFRAPAPLAQMEVNNARFDGTERAMESVADVLDKSRQGTVPAEELLALRTLSANQLLGDGSDLQLQVHACGSEKPAALSQQRKEPTLQTSVVPAQSANSTRRRCSVDDDGTEGTVGRQEGQASQRPTLVFVSLADIRAATNASVLWPQGQQTGDVPQQLATSTLSAGAGGRVPGASTGPVIIRTPRDHGQSGFAASGPGPRAVATGTSPAASGPGSNAQSEGGSRAGGVATEEGDRHAGEQGEGQESSSAGAVAGLSFKLRAVGRRVGPVRAQQGPQTSSTAHVSACTGTGALALAAGTTGFRSSCARVQPTVSAVAANAIVQPRRRSPAPAVVPAAAPATVPSAAAAAAAIAKPTVGTQSAPQVFAQRGGPAVVNTGMRMPQASWPAVASRNTAGYDSVTAASPGRNNQPAVHHQAVPSIRGSLHGIQAMPPGSSIAQQQCAAFSARQTVEALQEGAPQQQQQQIRKQLQPLVVVGDTSGGSEFGRPPSAGSAQLPSPQAPLYAKAGWILSSANFAIRNTEEAGNSVRARQSQALLNVLSKEYYSPLNIFRSYRSITH